MSVVCRRRCQFLYIGRIIYSSRSCVLELSVSHLQAHNIILVEITKTLFYSLFAFMANQMNFGVRYSSKCDMHCCCCCWINDSTFVCICKLFELSFVQMAISIDGNSTEPQTDRIFHKCYVSLCLCHFWSRSSQHSRWNG